VLSRLSGDFAQTAARVEAEIQQIAGGADQCRQPKQLGDIIFGKMGLPGGSKTKTGAWSTSAQVLDELAEQGHEFPKKILEWRQVSKLKIDLYRCVAGIRPSADPPRSHHLRACRDHHRAAVVQRAEPAETSRCGPRTAARSAAPSLPPPDNKLVSADYSQIELRLLAEIADIPVLKEAFRDGLGHSRHDGVRNVRRADQDMPSEVRRRAKAINFGIIYGNLGIRLAQQLGIAREKPPAYIKKYSSASRASGRYAEMP